MKNLFFATLVAVVAVGSAYAQEYSTGPDGLGVNFSCTTNNNAPTCEDELGFNPVVYIYPGSTRITLGLAELERQYVQF